MNIIRWFKNLPPDPVKHCKVYKIFGCAHVDGFLCDMRTCTISVDARVRPNQITELDILNAEYTDESK